MQHLNGEDVDMDIEVDMGVEGMEDMEGTEDMEGIEDGGMDVSDVLQTAKLLLQKTMM